MWSRLSPPQPLHASWVLVFHMPEEASPKMPR
jgi:hypothetical protein